MVIKVDRLETMVGSVGPQLVRDQTVMLKREDTKKKRDADRSKSVAVPNDPFKKAIETKV